MSATTHLKRYREIATILVKYGLEEFLEHNPILDFFNISRNNSKDDKIVTNRWVRIRKALEELGPTFVKIGQILSNRPDLLSRDLIRELEKLQDKVAPFEDEIARKIVEKELQCDVNQIFNFIEPSPLGSASISQVYKAQLKTGELVAVKVQRPGLKKIINTDLEIIKDWASFIENKTDFLKGIRISDIIEEFERTLHDEINFKFEASNIKKFRQNFQNDSRIIIPKVYDQFTTHKILTMEFIAGKKISLLDDNYGQEERQKLASLGVDIIFRQIFDYGLFHGDPHEGNLFIVDSNKVGLIDFGMVGRLTPTIQKYVKDIIIGLITKNTRMVVQAIQKINMQGHIENKQLLQIQLETLFERYLTGTLEEIQIGEALRDVIKVLTSFHLQLPPVFYLLIKSLVTIEGVALRVDPYFVFAKELGPHVKKIIRERYHPKYKAKEMSAFLGELVDISMDLPYELRDIFEQVKKGRAKVVFEHSGLEHLIEGHKKISDRIVISIILAALIIGSSLIVHSGISPTFYGVPIIGIIGYLLAGVIAFWLLFSLLLRR